ncbi:MAG: LacI family DNA-binding transcriptional regulator [Terriglobia bacterium]|jgi:LacI family transcriptional regulator
METDRANAVVQQSFAKIRVTLRDIAKECGVDVATVSRSLSGGYGIRKETRQRVLAVAQRLNYQPNQMARGLATGKSSTLALIISDIRNPFFSELARGAEDAASAAGYDLLLCNSDLDRLKQMRYLRSLLAKRVDGIVMNSVLELSPGAQDELSHCGVPIVLLSRSRDVRGFSTVTADNFQGGFLAGKCLIDLGHQVMAHFTGSRKHGNLADRANGFLKAVNSSEGKPEAIVIRGHHSYEGGCEMMQRLLRNRRNVSAVFACNDAVAFGAIRTAFEAGVRIPADISVVGFDNVEFAALTRPPLTTIDQPRYGLGQAAVEILLSHIGCDGPWAPEYRTLGVKLVERESCLPWGEIRRGGGQ